MITRLTTQMFQWIEVIELYGKTFQSNYNYNYYYNSVDDYLILEIAHDDEWVEYYHITESDKEYLGGVYDIGGIFSVNSEAPRNENGEIELNDRFC